MVVYKSVYQHLKYIAMGLLALAGEDLACHLTTCYKVDFIIENGKIEDIMDFISFRPMCLVSSLQDQYRSINHLILLIMLVICLKLNF